MILRLTRLLIIWIGLTGFSLLAQSNDQAQDELKDLQNQIKQKQADLAKQKRSARTLQDELKKAEVEIGESVKALTITKESIRQNESQQKKLKKEKSVLERKKSQQQGILAKQIRSAYIAGNHDYVKMLLNQTDPGKFERTISYYQYLNRARQSHIVSFTSLIDQIEDVNAKLIDSIVQLTQLQEKQSAQRALLALQQTERKQTLTSIRKEINSDEALIEQLQISEQSLKQAIEEAIREADLLARQQDQPLLGLSQFKGKLQRPAQGHLRNLFGKRRQGQLRWKGILIDGSLGASVQSVKSGQVLYADWLRGFGLLTVIDHGDGFMSLYGHNQALLKQVGDRVVEGETIALVGQSGGQQSPNLYFELRHKGKPINPYTWLRRRR